MREIKYLMGRIIPKIHILQEVIYINWLGYDWFIKKG